MSDVSNAVPTGVSPPPGPVGIGGWLILPIIGLFGALIVGVFQLMEYEWLSSTFSDLTRGQQLFVAFEVIANFVLTVAGPICLLILVFGKKHAFPKVYTVWGIANLIFSIGDLAVARVVFAEAYGPGGADLLNSETLGNIVRAMLVVGVWVVYMNVSIRVKNTFVN